MPLCIDLYTGLGGWSSGFLAEGYDCIGFDIERHVYGEAHCPAQLVLQDVLTIHGSQFRNADMIVASPPCQAYSYMAMPWSRAKREVSWQQWARNSPFGDFRLNDLFDACFRIQREACAAAGRHIPMVVENVKGAQPWVGRAAWHFGSFYLWGDVPAVMPIIPPHRKVPGFNFHAHEKGIAGGSFQSAAVAQGVKQRGSGPEWWREPLQERRKAATAIKNGAGWFSSGDGMSAQRRHSSRSDSRQAASAMIAKIPEELSRYIARFYRPHEAQLAGRVGCEVSGERTHQY